MTCRLRFITSTGALLPAEASDVIGLDADTIETARMSFDCPYCGEDYMIAIDLPTQAPYTFECDTCGNAYDLFDGIDSDEELEAVDILDVPNVIRDKQAVARLARNHHDPLFSLIAFGITQYVSGGMLVLSLGLFASGFFFFGTTLGTLVTGGAILLLLGAVALTSIVSSKARQALNGTGVEVSDINAIWRYRDVYRYTRAERAEELKQQREIEMSVEE